MTICFLREPHTFSSRVICVVNGECKYLGKKDEDCFYEHPCSEVYPKAITPSSEGYIAIKDILIDYGSGCVLVPSNTRLKGIRISYRSVRPLIREGSRVKVGGTIAYTVSNKGVLRKIRSHHEGKVVLVYSSPSSRPEDYIVFLDTDERCVWMERR